MEHIAYYNLLVLITFRAIETLSENGKGHTNKQCCCAGMRFAKLGKTKSFDPTELGMRKPLLRKETREKELYY
nr:hypothetical protein Iba_chr05bCG5460 [Ipomoea batatas]GMC95367.1 hypothetical protein Iba_chr05cCG7880 [Ipomoea batatas]